MEDALHKCFDLLMFSFSTLFLPTHMHLAHTEPGVTQVLFRSGHIDGGVRHAGNLIHHSLISLQAVWVLPFEAFLATKGERIALEKKEDVRILRDKHGCECTMTIRLSMCTKQHT